MPFYDFSTSDGERITREMTREQFVDLPLDESENRLALREGGKTYLHVRPTIAGDKPLALISPDPMPYVSPTLPRGIPGVFYNARGHAVVHGGRRQERAIEKAGYIS